MLKLKNFLRAHLCNKTIQLVHCCITEMEWVKSDDFITMEGFGLFEEQMLVDNDENAPNQPRNLVQVPTDFASTLHKCLTKDVKKLCVYDIASKLKNSGDYDIGGTYSPEPEFWFYYTTSVCPGYIYLLNLFVCHRQTGNFTISISNSNEFTQMSPHGDSTGHSQLAPGLTSFTFGSVRPNDDHYIKTFCFTQKDVKALENNTLFIPTLITTDVTTAVNSDVVKRIKLSHDFGALLSNKEKTDFVLESSIGKKFDVHKIILVAHSAVLRNAIKNTTTPSLFLDINEDDIALLLEFLYTGTIKEILKQDCLKLLDIAEKFELQNLFKLVQYAIGEQIKVSNAVDIVVLSEKYKLDKLQNDVFIFIKNNPGVLETEGWKNLDNVQLTKKMFQFIYNSKK